MKNWDITFYNHYSNSLYNIGLQLFLTHFNVCRYGLLDKIKIQKFKYVVNGSPEQVLTETTRNCIVIVNTLYRLAFGSFDKNISQPKNETIQNINHLNELISKFLLSKIIFFLNCISETKILWKSLKVDLCSYINVHKVIQLYYH